MDFGTRTWIFELAFLFLLYGAGYGFGGEIVNRNLLRIAFWLTAFSDVLAVFGHIFGF